ncbi:MAG: carbohydrate porin [Acidobacteriota bacterium]
MAIGEIALRVNGARGAGVLKGGVWSHRGGDRPADWGAYLLAETPAAQLRWTQTVIFCQAGASPPSASSVPYYLAAGVDFQGLLPSRPADHLVAGFARAWLRELPDGSETSWEITYILHLSPSLSIQPDLQYIVHPGGRYPNALAVLIRLGVRLH